MKFNWHPWLGSELGSDSGFPAKSSSHAHVQRPHGFHLAPSKGMQLSLEADLWARQDENRPGAQVLVSVPTAHGLWARGR